MTYSQAYLMKTEDERLQKNYIRKMKSQLKIYIYAFVNYKKHGPSRYNLIGPGLLRRSGLHPVIVES